ncbi:MAG: hypothetical protein KDA24_24665 [Deltaproteobacteria bacterium]|nr:hypothetical protein [Deltaproteobacteria bacterium]
MALIDGLLAAFPVTRTALAVAQAADVAPSSVPRLDMADDVAKAATLAKEHVIDPIPGKVLGAMLPPPPSLPPVPPLVKVGAGVGLFSLARWAYKRISKGGRRGR